MLKFIIFCLINLSLSSTEYNFTNIESYKYIEVNLDKEDAFFKYIETQKNIKLEILEQSSNAQLYTVYQYIKKEDVKFNETSKQYENYKSKNQVKNLEVFQKEANFFVITIINTNDRVNLKKATIPKYFTFMPEIPKDNFNINSTIVQYNKINEYNNIYVEISFSSLFNYLTIFSGGKDLIFSMKDESCYSRICNFEIGNYINNNSLKATIHELNIRNTDLESKVTPRKIYYLLYNKPLNPINYYGNNYTKYFYFESIDYSYSLKDQNYINQYIELKEGAIVYYTHPNNLTTILMNSDTISISSVPQFWYSSNNNESYYIIYFLPKNNLLNSNILEFNLNYGYHENLMGDISIIAVKPTQIIYYPQTFEYSEVKDSKVPKIIRITFDKSLNDKLLLEFPKKTQCTYGTLFTDDTFIPPFDCSFMEIDSSYQEKNLTVIFKDLIQFKTSKKFNFITLQEYELKYFSFEEQQNEIAFKFKKKYATQYIYINLLNPNKNYKYYIYKTESDIKYDPLQKLYLNYFLSGNLDYMINFIPSYMKTEVIIIIQKVSNEILYSDYITIREGIIDVTINNPYSFDKFQNLSYVVFQFKSNENKKYRIETNTEFGGYNQTINNSLSILNNNLNESIICQDKYCLFKFEGIETQYLSVITNKLPNDKNSNISKLMYILFNEDVNEYEMENSLSSKLYFISSFQYTFKIMDEEIIKKLNEANEGGFVLKVNKDDYSKYNMDVIYINDYSITPIVNITKTSKYDYYYYYITTNSTEYKFKIISSFTFDKPSFFSFAYISPITIINFPININIPDTHSEGIPVFGRLVKKNLNSDIEYIIGVYNTAQYTEGKIINNEGTGINTFNNVVKYQFAKNYPNEIYTFIFPNHPQIVFGEINGEYVYTEKREYITINYNFKKGENKFYIRLFNHPNINTCSYLDGNENNIINIYNLGYLGDIGYLVKGEKINSNFICFELGNSDIYKFNSTENIDSNFIIFDPTLKEEKLTLKNRKFFIPKKKTIYFLENEIEYEIFRIITKEYTKNAITLYYSKTRYELTSNNNYTFIREYNKTESENYNFSSSKNSMIIMTILKGKIYQEITLQKNESTISLNNNSVAFELLYGTNFSSYIIAVNNYETKFYYKVYETNETHFGKLLPPQFISQPNIVDVDQSKRINLPIKNPYFEGKTPNQKYIFIMSYEHDFEKEFNQKNNYSLQLIYVPIENHDYELLNESSFNIIDQKNMSSNYSIGKGKEGILLMTLSKFTDMNILNVKAKLSSTATNYEQFIEINQRYNQFIEEKKLFKELKYDFNVIPLSEISGNYSCIELSFKYVQNIKERFDIYNSKILNVKMNSKGLITFDSLKKNNVIYEIYITNKTEEYKKLFENDCFLLEQKKKFKNNNNEGLILYYEVNDTQFKLDKIEGNYLINVVGIDLDYHMRIIYNSYKYEASSNFYLFIILIVFIFIVIGFIILIKIHKKKEYSINTLINGPFEAMLP